MLIRVPFSEVTAILVPCKLRAIAAQDALVGRSVHGRLLSTGQVHALHVARVGAREGQAGDWDTGHRGL